MKKLNIVLLSALFLSGAVGIFYKTNAWRRGRGRRHGRVGFGIGFGVGVGHRPYYRRPWYRRPYYGIGTWFGSAPAKRYYSWRDSQDLMYWQIANNTGSDIRISSDSSSIQLAPGESKKLYRDRSFVLDIENLNTGRSKNYETKNHVIEIGRNLRIKSYIN